MGTHNKVMDISSESFPDCYLEVIAIDHDAPAPGRLRWFGLDHLGLREAIRDSPRLVHAVARTHKIGTLRQDLAKLALNPGQLLTAQRDTPHGQHPDGRCAAGAAHRDAGIAPRPCGPRRVAHRGLKASQCIEC